MEDPFIDKMIEAVAAMREGRFDVPVPQGGEGGIGRLAAALKDLRITLGKHADEQQLLLRLTEEINAGLTIDEILSDIFDSFKSLIPYDRIGLALIVDEGRTVRSRWVRSNLPDVVLGPNYAAPLAGSSLEPLIETGHPRIINDLASYMDEHPLSVSTQLILSEGMRSSLTCPLIAEAKPVGYLFFSSTRANSYRDVHVELFVQIAGQVATSVEKARLYEELVRLNDIRNRFLGIAAHDLRNPISVIQGYIRLFTQSFFGDIPEKQLVLMERVDVACQGMLALINDLLDISAIESGRVELEPESVRLGSFLEESCSINRVIAEAKGIDIELEVEPDLPRVRLDPKRLNQVMNNLFSNAVKFSFPGTTIRVKAQCQKGEALITVEDQGQGIPEADLPKIFAEFGRASTRPTAGERSTGLGLAIVKKIVKMHGGRVWVKSRVGAGSTFGFTLPFESDKPCACNVMG